MIPRDQGNLHGTEIQFILHKVWLRHHPTQRGVFTCYGNSAKLYVNGIVADTKAVTIAPASFNPVLNYLGDSQYGADPLFNGRLDELFIFNYALSETEIARLAANQPPPPTTPTVLSVMWTGDAVQLLWPSNYVGCRVESNAVGLTATRAWLPTSGAAVTNQLVFSVTATDDSVFFRLVYP